MSERVALVGDVGGTNTRLGFVVRGRLTAIRVYTNATHRSLDSCIESALQSAPDGVEPQHLLLALAAPVSDDDEVTLTNLDWRISATRLRNRFKFDEVSLINDFVALAHALPALGSDDLLALGGGRPIAGAPAIVIGPGTGFGAALRLADDTVVATEAGHTLLAASNREEAALLESLRADGAAPSREAVLSGAGLTRLYHTLCTRTGAPVEEDDFVAAYAAGRTAAREALARFFAFLGLTARDLALAGGAQGGVYLAGGILPRYAAELAASVFRSRFETPAPLAGYLEAIPTMLITHEQPALLGLLRLVRAT